MSSPALQAAHRLDPDTQAVLLLCGWFGPPPAAGGPLGIAEYNSLAQWLQQQTLRPSDLFAGEWQQREGLPIPRERLQALLERGVALALAVENWTNQGLWVISRSDAGYPARLKTYLGRLAPPLLFGAGNTRDAIPDGGLAIVGARDADEEALAYAAGVAQSCAGAGIPVISGAARGVDSTAMEAALAAGGMVAGMLADSLARSAASRRYRQALLDGRLTLLSPYHPQAGFSTGNAMARNKYIYALAQWGLVVSSGAHEGGTWAGAVEALRAGRIPVFVRLAGEVPEGNRHLADRGALPFPQEPWTDLPSRLEAAGQTHSEANAGTPPGKGMRARRTGPPSGQLLLVPGVPQDTPPASDPAPVAVSRPAAKKTISTSGPTDDALPSPLPASIFEAVRPVLLAYLREPRTLQELAAALEVRPAQMQDWLDHALQEGSIGKRGRPVRYAVQPLGTSMLKD